MKKFTIALVEAGTPSTHMFSRTYLPRTGLPTIGAVLKNLGYECGIWFETMSPLDVDMLRGYDIVGIGSLTNTISHAYRLADSLKKTGGPIVVMGGPHVTFMPEEALEHCDYVVMGEGEETLPELIAAIENTQALEEIPGIAYRLETGEIRIAQPGRSVDFASLPSPDFTLSPQITSGRIPPIITSSRGCPHDCSFCSVTSVFGRKYRFKGNEQVVDELRSIKDRSVCFGDDNFFANTKRTKSLLKDMISKDAVPLRWSAEMAVKAAFDEELLGLMRETRCRIVYVGIESVDPETLKRYGKVHEMELTARCVENLHRYGIGIHGMFVVDAENTPETVRNIVDYAIETDIDSIQICSLTPFPGTRSYEEYQDRLLHRQWEYFEGMHVVVRPEKCSAYDMQMAIITQMQRFYSISRVISAYRKGRSWRIKYLAGGNYLMRKWVKENADYLERLKNGYYPSARSKPVFAGA
ncbi:MAG TPA: B12-binding domain-containing radical SAM protein [Deltaproteobacteria bacterium]|nr:B12-binding domain-containing radical SAM protein [Deltaproteobacteria bacterium]